MPNEEKVKFLSKILNNDKRFLSVRNCAPYSILSLKSEILRNGHIPVIVF